jgi:class 3 adenylate cyclase
MAGDADPVLAHIESFVTGRPPGTRSDRVLATVLFTEIAEPSLGSTRVGDTTWIRQLDEFDALIQDALSTFRGRAVNTSEGELFASFDRPSRAIACAQAIRGRSRELGLKVRTGLHTGEVQVSGVGLSGLTVNIGARVCGLADPWEVLVSRTVTDLVAGLDLAFSERGTHVLKGVPGTWPVYALVDD